MSDDELARADFGDDFTWGAASAAYQVEGAWNVDGKGPSVWDHWSHRRVKLVGSHDDGDTACDFYHRYTGDIAILKELGFGAMRFSTSWPRVLPEGTGQPNRAGLDFYSRVVDECLSAGVEPWITLYHWDLPLAIHRRGGWTNRDVLGWFGDYVALMADTLGDRVRNWMIFNEPLSFLVFGQLVGLQPPRRFGLRSFLSSLHHVNLCQAIGAAAIRARVPDSVVGTTHYMSPLMRTGNTRMNVVAERGGDAFVNRAYLEPNLGLGYPVDDCRLLGGIERHIRTGDDELIRVDWDFLGVQYYTRLKVPPLPVPGLWTIPYFGRDVKQFEVTAMGWEVRPDGLYDALAAAHAYGRFPRLVVTENGAAFPDRVEPGSGRIRDPRRVAFYEAHLREVARARRDGIPVDGYFAWTLTDNFEWTSGYRPRFGLVHIDYATQQRLVKDSGRWFQRLLSG
jgi:beta-glucosidase